MEIDSLLKHYEELKSKGLKIDATRGKPSKAQLDLSNPILSVLNENTDFSKYSLEARNYGGLDGLKEAKDLISELVDVDEKNVFVCGNASLNVMYELVSKSMLFGVLGNERWVNSKSIKWICLVPGYDRHFSICEHLGIEMINVPLLEDGPDMDKIEELVKDPCVKGVWCVPKFSNPTGCVYSDEIITRFAKLKPAAKDFRIYWDNAYFIHDFDFKNEQKVLNIFKEATKYGNEDMIYEFVSFSKISFSGAGMAAFIASENNISDFKKHMSNVTIGYDKINQLRHVLFFKNRDGVIKHMEKHATILRPKFEAILNYFDKELKGIATWSKPKGGYFICLKVKNCAKEVIQRCAECGISLTAAGCSHPYHNDPENAYIRIAPTCLKNEEISSFCDVVCTSVKIETSLLKF